MSTRASIVVREGTTKQLLYRRLDGYPCGIGIELLAALRALQGPLTAHDLVETTIETIREEIPTVQDATDIPGDVEWIYTLSLQQGQQLSITVESRGMTRKMKKNFEGSIAEYVDFLNSQVTGLNQWRKSHYGAGVELVEQVAL